MEQQSAWVVIELEALRQPDDLVLIDPAECGVPFVALADLQNGCGRVYLDRALAGIEAQRCKGLVLELGLCEEVVGDAR